MVSHYFENIDIIFLIYTGHVRIAIYDPGLSTENKACQEFENKKYLVAELQSGLEDIGDKELIFWLSKPEQIIR
jgi:hypothetical protein